MSDQSTVTQPLQWPDEVDEIFTGDLVVTVGSPTPAGGVVLNSVTPLGLRDRNAGTVMFTTSLGFGRKLERIAADPRIAVAYSTREHGHSQRPGYVLVQGIADVIAEYTQERRDELVEQAQQHIGQVADGRFWDWWLKVYYFDRVGVEVKATRILWWPSGSLADEPVVIGEPLPTLVAPSQPPPRQPAVARVPVGKVVKSARMPHRLLGITDAGGMPVIVPVEVVRRAEHGLVLDVPSGIVPPGGRRAGFIAHQFRPKLIGLATATHTGWLEVGAEAVWTPHTRHGFVAPPNKTLLLLGNGAAARWGYRQAIKAGRDDIVKLAGRQPRPAG